MNAGYARMVNGLNRVGDKGTELQMSLNFQIA
jgi:hypothetical protein